MKTTKRVIVGAIIVSKDNKVLLGQTGKEAVGVYSGNWVVPGGGVDEGETKLQALKREMLEETRIDINSYPVKFVNVTYGKSPKKLKETGELVIVDMTFNNYLITINDKAAGEIGNDPTEELEKIQWFSPEELKRIKIAPPTAKLLEDLSFL